MNNEWTKVKDKLPPQSNFYEGQSDTCLVAYEGEHFVAYCVFSTKRWYTLDDDLLEPTHWMKLPELPKD